MNRAGMPVPPLAARSGGQARPGRHAGGGHIAPVVLASLRRCRAKRAAT